MTIREEILRAMATLGKEPDTCCIGYNVRYGRAGGSLNDFPEDRLFEMPLSENLMAGSAIGMSLEGWVPLVWFERADFLFCALDAIVNQINYLSQLSEGMHKPGVIIRVCVGNKEGPLFTGPTHTQNPFAAMVKLVQFQVLEITKAKQVETYYRWALENARKGKSTMIFESKDRYNDA